MHRPSVELSQSLPPAQAASPRPTVRFALGWASSMACYFFGIYFACNWIVSKKVDVPSLFFGWELRLPFVPAMIVPYLSEDLFFFFAPFLCTTRAELRNLGLRLTLAVNVAAFCFLLFPLHVGFSREPVGGVNGLLFTLLNALDKPYNLVPSLHLAVLVVLWSTYSRHVLRFAWRLLQVWYGLIGISTVLTRQHQVIDVITGLALGAFCLYVVPDREILPVALKSRKEAAAP